MWHFSQIRVVVKCKMLHECLVTSKTTHRDPLLQTPSSRLFHITARTQSDVTDGQWYTLQLQTQTYIVSINARRMNLQSILNIKNVILNGWVGNLQTLCWWLLVFHLFFIIISPPMFYKRKLKTGIYSQKIKKAFIQEGKIYIKEAYALLYITYMQTRNVQGGMTYIQKWTHTTLCQSGIDITYIIH